MCDGVELNASSSSGVPSADGTRIAFVKSEVAPEVATGVTHDVHVHDSTTGATTLVSRAR